MQRKLTPKSTLENLKREAKRWLKALRENDIEARARLQRANPTAPASPTLRDVQHALALEHGLSGWTELKQQLENGHAAAGHVAESHDSLISRFLQNACPDHHIRGGPAHVMALGTAEGILKQHPEIARESLRLAIVCGEVGEVERILRERPEAATEKTAGLGYDREGVGGSDDIFTDLGPMNWEPLLYVCFTRLRHPPTNENAVAIARLLLDHGANPNSYFMAGDSQYTPLVGAIGEGEENRPPHPRRDNLVKLLLERGANPFDMQVTYNTHFDGDILWLLELQYEFSIKSGAGDAWADPAWSMFDMGGYGTGARFMLGGAIDRNRVDLVRWMLEHGADPNAPPPRKRNRYGIGASARLSNRSLYEEAVLKGNTEIAELLVRYGASPDIATPDGADAFAAACLRGDRREAEKLLANHPDYLLLPRPMVIAAGRDKVEVVKLLLDMGMPIEIENPEEGNAHPLHVAASSDSLRVAKLLVERGAAIDPRETVYSSTPLWGAVWRQRSRMIDFLAPLSRDVWSLAIIGDTERLREVLDKEPRLARSAGEYETPLMWLAADEERALEIAEMLVANGADPRVADREGRTAADLAERRGLTRVAAFLREAEGKE